MTAKLWEVSTTNAFSTTLDGSISAEDATITLTSVTGLVYPGILVIDRVDGVGNNTPLIREYISYTGITASQLTGVTRGVANSSAQAHSSGAVVEEVLSVTHWADMIDYIVDQDNTLQANITAIDTTTIVPHDYAASIDLDRSDGFYHIITAITGDITLTASNITSGDKLMVKFVYGDSSAHTVTWPATVKWPGGAAPSLTCTENSSDIFGLICTGTDTYDGVYVGFDTR